MKDVVGSPGTWSGLALRVSQCLCAAASITAMASAQVFSYYSAFMNLFFSMGMLLLWSFVCAWVRYIFFEGKT